MTFDDLSEEQKKRIIEINERLQNGEDAGKDILELLRIYPLRPPNVFIAPVGTLFPDSEDLSDTDWAPLGWIKG